MNAKNIAVAYCADNEPTVKQIEQQLNLAGYQFQHFAGTKSTAMPPLADQLLSQPSRILLIISDNYLKAAQCMHRGLKLLQEKRSLILPVVIEGVAKDEESGKTIKIQTDFERVSDIIQYINYWQDQYLDLRRQKRQMKDFDEDAFNAHLKIMREISSEAGEFLRVLRGMNYLTHEELLANHFEKFFQFNQDSEGWSRFKSKAPAMLAKEPPAPPAEAPMAEEETEKPAPQPEQAEKPEEQTEAGLAGITGMGQPEERKAVEEEPIKQPEEQPEADLADIPGMDLLEGRQPAAEEPEEENPAETEPVNEEVAEAIEWSIDQIGRETPAAEAEEPEPAEEEDENAREAFYPDDDEDDAIAEEEEEEEEEEEPEEDQAAVLLEEAMEYFNTGQVQEGLAFLAQAVEENPENHYLRYHQALMLAQRGRDYQAARKALGPVVEAEPDNEPALFLMGELNELLEDFESARKHYRQLIEVNPEYPNASYRLGMILAAHFEGQQKAASKYLKKAIQQDKNNADACYQYALLLNEAMGKPKKAIKLLKKTLKIDPQHPFANYDLALAYYQMGDRGKAKQAYARAIAINPELHTPENDLAFQEKAPTPAPAPAAVSSSIEHDMIEALKTNINRLEELLLAREEEAENLRQEMEEQAVPEPPKADQAVLITGATSGIGKATAEIFAKNGYRVIITGRRAKRLEELKGDLEEAYSADILAIAFDVRDEGAVKEVMEKLGDKDMEVDILINNAGKAKGLAPIHEGNLDHWEEMIDTNLKGLLYMTRAVAPGMVRRRSGHIINVGSTAGRDVYPNGNVYCATKAAVEALTRSMRLDLHQHNVRVSMVSPAHVEETEFALVRFDGDEEKAKIYDGFKPLSSSDVAEAIFFMATRPAHVNVLDIVLQGVQQASSLVIDRSGREQYGEEEEED